MEPESSMNRRFPSPFGKIESTQLAVVLSRYSVAAFVLWALLLLAQGALIGGGAHAEAASTMAFLVLQAILAFAAAGFVLRKPNRILPAFGLAWSLYELSSVLVGLMLGAPMAIGGLPAWMGSLSTGVLMVCAILHIGGLRGAMALGRLS